MAFGSGAFGGGPFGGTPSTPAGPAASSEQLKGQNLIDLANARLAGYQNGIDSEALLSFLNEGKDEIWAILKNLNEEYFVTPSQSTDATADFYFAPLDPTVRQYTLPSDLREVKFIEVTTPSYTQLKFTYKDITDDDFRNARRDASTQADSSTGCNEIYYTILGKNGLVLAQFPPAAVQLLIWYVRAIPDFETDQAIDEVLYPYTKKIAEYAAKKTMLALQDPGQFSAWVSEWKQDVITVQNSAAGRNSADAVFVDDFWG